MRRAGLKPEDTFAILLTHEHADHACGVVRFANRYRCRVFASTLTAEAMRSRGLGEDLWQVFKTGGAPFGFGSFRISPFEVWHDAADPCGFLIEDCTHAFRQLAFATDLGKCHQGMLEACKEATTIFLEANYAKAMIDADKTRPWKVRERIMSFNGHLSNENAASAVSTLLRLKKVILGHLSAATNHPDVALGTVRTALAGRIPEVEVHTAFIPEHNRCQPPLEFEIL
jgi:phosphoribosyl 1,2-cyclic phosphodiesterase